LLEHSLHLLLGNIKATHSVAYASKQDSRVEEWKDVTTLLPFERNDAFGFIALRPHLQVQYGGPGEISIMSCSVTSIAVAVIHDAEGVKESS
jgi:hypothetical protein